MKTDTTTMVLNLVLLVLAVLGVVCAIVTFTRTHDYRQLNLDATRDKNFLMLMQNLAGQTEAYNQKYPDPKLTAIIQAAFPKQPAHQ